MQLHHTCGEYKPSVFNIWLNTSETLINLDSLSEEMKYTLIHEYTHFLQDIMTNYGMITILQYLHELQLFRKTILDNSIKEFTIPVEYNLSRNIEQIRKKLDCVFGEGNINFEIKEINKYEIKTVSLDSTTSEEIVIVNYTDIFDNNDLFQFGALCILECMANLIEKYNGSKVYSKEFPYTSVELFVEKSFPSFKINEENLIVLCELSLNSSNPAIQFVELLNGICSSTTIPNNHIDIYAYYEIKLKNQRIEYLILAERVKEELMNFYSLEIEKAILERLMRIIDMGIALRENKLGNVIFDSISEERENRIRSIMHKTGIPLVENSVGQLYYSEHPNTGESNYIILRAIDEVYNVLRFGSRCCSMTNICKNDKKFQINNVCKNSPWEKVNLESLCPFAKLWHKEGFEFYYPK